MPPLRIPPRYQAGIRAIASLDDAAVHRLSEALAGSRRRLGPESLARDIEKAVPELRDRASEAVEALVSLIALMDEDEARLEQLAQDVASSEDLDLPEEDREELSRRIGGLLKLPLLALAARAYDIAGEYERVFHDARVMTDIRPVFGVSVSEGPRAALTPAMLKIEWHPYSDGGAIESEFFALDRADLIRLRKAVDRALDKITSLEQLIASMNLAYWEYREQDEDA